MDALDTTALSERKDARANRERILLAAREELSARGRAVEIKDVAERAGVGVGTVYRHFESRERLLNAVIAATRAELLEEMKAAAAIGPPDAALRAIVNVGALAHERFGALIKLAVSDEFAEPSEFEKREFHGLVDEVLRRGIAAGTFRADLEPAVVIAVMEGVFISGGLAELAETRGFAAASAAVSGFLLNGCYPGE